MSKKLKTKKKEPITLGKDIEIWRDSLSAKGGVILKGPFRLLHIKALLKAQKESGMEFNGAMKIIHASFTKKKLPELPSVPRKEHAKALSKFLGIKIKLKNLPGINFMVGPQ